ncbi:hypothetical protein VOLCADRAFT_108746 [Volvox carteri f. nagariensis]|uniref:Uncharacterized protein n=1 Tax=Volvox carteri f. nagariensis TaxID=3068 RepID=D8UM90_VOLCA|nr:uncharacterized protein VOLCADRAFT_108746 [Volvox carteri f. nagariensis]EFJ39159.1 hypothetical protein VOLCADRAFT_108746 [Volvox carteri f. nagariensis]|eukprot:XP_002959776.1 hypothetical protein VOLCADRAFT_108746 [Volvox carteri f. nagariensis]
MGKFYIAYRMKRQGIYYHIIQVQSALQAQLETPQHLTYVNRYNECLELLRECFPEADLQPLHLQPCEAPEAVQELAHRMLSAALQTPEDCAKFREICAKTRGKRAADRKSECPCEQMVTQAG